MCDTKLGHVHMSKPSKVRSRLLTTVGSGVTDGPKRVSISVQKEYFSREKATTGGVVVAQRGLAVRTARSLYDSTPIRRAGLALDGYFT